MLVVPGLELSATTALIYLITALLIYRVGSDLHALRKSVYAPGILLPAIPTIALVGAIAVGAQLSVTWLDWELVLALAFSGLFYFRSKKFGLALIELFTSFQVLLVTARVLFILDMDSDAVYWMWLLSTWFAVGAFFAANLTSVRQLSRQGE